MKFTTLLAFLLLPWALVEGTSADADSVQLRNLGRVSQLLFY
jgi:hypothetical protein